MSVFKEVTDYNVDYEKLKEELGVDTCKKIGAILNILEIGQPNVAHSKMVLHVCEDVLEHCSLTFGTKKDV